MAAKGTFDVYQRSDGTWAWRLKASNGQVVATDGGQGYSDKADCESMGRRVVSGDFKDAVE